MLADQDGHGVVRFRCPRRECLPMLSRPLQLQDALETRGGPAQVGRARWQEHHAWPSPTKPFRQHGDLRKD